MVLQNNFTESKSYDEIINNNNNNDMENNKEQKLVELPKYWCVKLTEDNSEEFIKHVVSYLDEIDFDNDVTWLEFVNGDNFIDYYFGYDGDVSDANGTFSYIDLNECLNKPTVLTLEEFIELRHKNTVKEDIINNPHHYGGKDNVYEAIKVIEAWDLGFRLGNTVKYISRAGKKEPNKTIQDLEKARYYLDREIMILKGEL